MNQDTQAFERHRPRLLGLAYRMLGSRAEAEDMVQEAYLRWHGADRGAVAEPFAYLARTVSRLCLDHLKSARARRETYVGPWLPEPVVDSPWLAPAPDPDWLHDVSYALMLALERLSPLERAAFLLHDVFDVEFAEIAGVLDRSEAACRQLATRAREHVREARPRFAVSAEEGNRLAQAFLAAVQGGDTDGLMRMLAKDAVLLSDGGGKRLAALNPILGADKITRFLMGVRAKAEGFERYAYRPARVNGLPGFLVSEPDGAHHTMAFDMAGGRVVGIYVVLNPDKLALLQAVA
jgi:RNA polymerase sigma-70 factor, ECF subfamily